MSKCYNLKKSNLKIKKMKKSVLLSAVVALFISMSFTSNASNITVQNETCVVSQQGPQDRGQRMTSEERVAKQLETYQKKLSLTEDQAASIKTVLTKNAETMEAKMKAARESGSRPDRSEMEKMREKENTEVRALLNDDQKTAFDKLLKEQEEKMKSRRSRK